MKITCPSCAVKNNIPDTPEPNKIYRCGKCKSRLFNPESANNPTPKVKNIDKPAVSKEKDSPDNNLIDLWLTSDEIALIVSCLDWVLEDVESANADFNKLDTRIHKMLSNKVPSDAFNRIVPLIKSVEKNILMHSLGHFEVTHDAPGREYLQHKLTELDKAATDIQRFKGIVSIGTSVNNMSNHK